MGSAYVVYDADDVEVLNKIMRLSIVFMTELIAFKEAVEYCNINLRNEKIDIISLFALRALCCLKEKREI